MRRRRQLGTIKRCGDRRDADAEADDQPAKNQQRDVGCERLQQRARDEQRAGDQHGAAAAIVVGQPAAGERADQRAERHPARHHLDQEGAQREVPLDAVERARDDALVVAEQQARHDDDGEHHDERAGQRFVAPSPEARRLDRCHGFSPGCVMHFFRFVPCAQRLVHAAASARQARIASSVRMMPRSSASPLSLPMQE
jgi:hypothetical protein